MRKPVKLAISIYLGTILIICCSYLILILIGSMQGNDMKGAVTDVRSTEHIKSTSTSTSNTDSQLYKLSQNLQIQTISTSNNQQIIHSLVEASVKIPSINWL